MRPRTPMSRPPRFVPLVLLVGLVSAGAVQAQAPDLSLVSGDALVVVHVRVADLYRSDGFKDLRQIIEKAGPKALAAFNQRFVPPPASLDRVTLVVYPPSPNSGNAPSGFVVARTSAPFQPAEFVKVNLANAVVDKIGGVEFYSSPGMETGLCFLDKQTFVLGDVRGVRRALESPRDKPGAFQPLLNLTQTKPIALAVQPGPMKPMLQQALPGPFAAFAETQLLTLAVSVDGKPHIDLQANFGTADQAEAGERAVRTLIQLANVGIAFARPELEKMAFPPTEKGVLPWDNMAQQGAGLMGLGALNIAAEVLESLPVKRQGAQLGIAIDMPQGPAGAAAALGGIGVGLLLPAVQKVREAANRMNSSNNLKQIGLALHNYHDTFNTFPPAAIRDKQGKALLSWRVAILPYVEQDHLYRQFKLDEPWDSPANKKLIAQMPRIYLQPQAPVGGAGLTFYRGFIGPEAFFAPDKGRRIANITDGTSNTLMIVESGEPVEWTRPEELEYDPKKPLPRFARFSPNGFNVLLCDGSVRFIQSTIDEKTLRALITPAGGEVINLP